MNKVNLEQFVGTKMWLICVNNNCVLRRNDCAYFIAKTEEDAFNYYKSIKNELPPNLNFSATDININDINTFSLLYNNTNYPRFYIVNYGYISSMQLIKRFPNMAEEIKNAIIRNNYLYTVLDAKEIPNITHSFYSSEELAHHYGNKIVKVSINQVLQNLCDVCAYLFDEKLVYGFDFYEGVSSGFRHLHLDIDTLTEAIQDKELVSFKDLNNSNAIFPIFIKDDNKSLELFNSNGLQMYNITDYKEWASSINGNDIPIIINGIIKYAYVSDVYVIKTQSQQHSIGHAIKAVTQAAQAPYMYILLSGQESRKGLPFLVNNDNNLGLLLFYDKNEAFKYINECKVNAEVGLIDNNSIGQSLKTLAIISIYLNIKTIEFCYKAPINDTMAEQNLCVSLKEVIHFMDIFDTSISLLTTNSNIVQPNFNKYQIVTKEN